MKHWIFVGMALGMIPGQASDNQASQSAQAPRSQTQATQLVAQVAEADKKEKKAPEAETTSTNQMSALSSIGQALREYNQLGYWTAFDGRRVYRDPTY